jgi:hypothetical protein
MAVQRDSQFEEWARLVVEELPEHDSCLGTTQVDWEKSAVKLLSQRVYDLTQFIVKQAFEDELVPEDILYKNGKPVLMYPENLAEWFKRAPFLASYDGLPNEVKAWVEQDLGWKRDEVTSVDIENLSALRGAPCVLISVTMWRGQEARSQEFIRGDNGWRVAYEVTE